MKLGTYSVPQIRSLLLTFDKTRDTLSVVDCRGENHEESTNRFITGDAGPAGAQDASSRTEARVGHCAAYSADLAGGAACGPGVVVPGTASAGGARLDCVRMGSIR